jgi:hypothetical protein
MSKRRRVGGITPNDWQFLDDVLTSVVKKATDLQKISLPGDPTLGPITPDAAKAYLSDVAQFFNEAERHAIDLAKNAVEGSPQYELGHEIGRNLIVGAKRAAKIARDVGSDLADTFDKTADRLEEGGLTIARTFGFGAALVVIALLIFFGRKAGA